MTVVTIDKRFCGPRASANGGYASGVFAEAANKLAGGDIIYQVTLKSPPPLGAPIEIVRKDERVFEARADGNPVALIEAGEVVIEDPADLPPDDAIVAARNNFLCDAGGEHLLPYCFVCGNKREPGDGLRIFSGPAPDSPLNADFWTPSADLADAGGLVLPEYLWAALDCPGAFALRNGLGLCLLGRFAADIRRRPAPDEKLIVAAWKTGQDGRKHYSTSALYDEKRELVAAANAVWIELNDPGFLEKLRMENM